MMDHLLNLELPADHDHPPAPSMTWDDYVEWVDAHQRTLLASGRYAQLLSDFAETHKGEPFVLHGD
jgi:hypothetical protein